MTRRPAWEVVLLCALAVSPIVWSAAALWSEWHPVGDVAVIGLRAGDVVSAEPPLVGMPTTLSRSLGEQAYHPGPLEFWLLALPVKLSGGSRLAPMLTIALLNGAAVAAVVVLARRAAGRAAAAVAAAGALVLLASLRGELLVDPWNPHAALLPLAACVVALAADLGGVRWALAVAAFAGSVGAQAHLASAAAVAGAVVGWAAVAIVRRADRDDRRALAAGAVVLALCWAPVAVGEVTRSPGNLRTLGSAGGDEDTLGSDAGVALATNALVPTTVWMSPSSGADEALARASLPRMVAALVVAGAAIGVACLWWRRGHRFVLPLVAIGLTALAVGAAAATQIPATNALALHSFLWSWPVGAIVWAAIASGLVLVWRPLAVVMVAAAALVVVAAPPRVVGDRRTMSSVGTLASQLRTGVEPGTYRAEWGEGRLDAGRVVVGLLYALEDSPIDLRLEPSAAPSVTARRTASADEDLDALVVAAAHVEPPAPPDQDSRLVAEFRPDPDVLRRLRAAEQQVLGAVDRAGGIRFETGERFVGAEARRLVESGDFVLYARLGVVAAPDIGTAQLDRLAARQAEPVSFVRVFLRREG